MGTTTKTKTTRTKTASRKTSKFTATIHPRITPRNDAFFRKQLAKSGITQSEAIDGMISAFKNKTVFTMDTATTK